MEGFVVVTVLQHAFDAPQIQCCNCNHVFDEKDRPKVDDTCPGCKHIIGQIEIM